MPEDEKEKLSKLEEMKTRLSSRNYKIKNTRFAGLSRLPNKDVPESWGEKSGDNRSFTEKFLMQTSIFKKFFIFSLMFFILAVGIAGFVFLGGGNTVSNENIDITILGNTFTAGGEELPLIIEIANRNNASLELSDLLIEYPKSSSGDLTQGAERTRISIGGISAGGVHSENVKVTLFGEQGSVRPIKISLEYRLSGSNAIFVKEKIYNITISSAPIDLSVSAPSEASPNQDITFDIKAFLNATQGASDLLLQIDYPTGFQFEKANPAPSFGNNVWDLGDFAPGSEQKISITGKMIDVFDGEEKTFHIWSGSASEEDKSSIGIVFNSTRHVLTIQRPFIEAKLFVNGVYQREYATDAKTIVSGEVRWANNLDTKVNDLEIRAKISGNAVNRSSIVAQQGFYNSSQDTIIWDRNSLQKFAEVSPGESGSVTFSLSPLSLFSASSSLLSDPSIFIDISITGKQSLEGNVLQQLDNSESKIIRVMSDVGLATKALYFSGPFSNIGPIPPKVDQETTYTIVWSISNTANNLSRAQVRAFLPPWVKFVGSISPPSESVTYDASSKEIVWNVGNIPKGTGITSTDREVAFQVSLLPSLSQLGTAPAIINDAILTAHDDFANVDVRVNKASLNTRLSGDPMLPMNGDRVVE